MQEQPHHMSQRQQKTLCKFSFLCMCGSKNRTHAEIAKHTAWRQTTDVMDAAAAYHVTCRISLTCGKMIATDVMQQKGALLCATRMTRNVMHAGEALPCGMKRAAMRSSSMSSTSPCSQPPSFKPARMWRSASKCMSCKYGSQGRCNAVYHHHAQRRSPLEQGLNHCFLSATEQQELLRAD